MNEDDCQFNWVIKFIATYKSTQDISYGTCKDLRYYSHYQFRFLSHLIPKSWNIFEIKMISKNCYKKLVLFVTLLCGILGFIEAVSRCVAECPDTREEVCGEDGMIYWNSCQLDCLGKYFQYFLEIFLNIGLQ